MSPVANCPGCGSPLSNSGPLCEACLSRRREASRQMCDFVTMQIGPMDFSQEAQGTIEVAWKMGYEAGVRACRGLFKRNSLAHRKMREKWPKLGL